MEQTGLVTSIGSSVEPVWIHGDNVSRELVVQNREAANAAITLLPAAELKVDRVYEFSHGHWQETKDGFVVEEDTKRKLWRFHQMNRPYILTSGKPGSSEYALFMAVNNETYVDECGYKVFSSMLYPVPETESEVAEP